MAPIRKQKVIGVLLIAAIIVAAAVLWFLRHEEKHRTSLVLYGNIEIRQVDVAFNASERVERMLAEEGDVVEKGQLLGTVQTERFQASADRAEAQVASQRQVVARLETGSRPQEIQKASADVAAAQARAKDAQATLARVQAAVESDAVSRQDLDNALARNDVALADLKAAEEALALVLEGPRQEDIAAAKATLKALTAEAALARKNLADANLFSPSDGIIQNRILEPGDMASPQTAAYILALTDPIWVRVYVSETELGKIRPGMSAKVSTDSFGDKFYDGWVGFISPTAEFTPKTVETEDLRTSLVYQVRVYIKNPQNELRLGMPVTVTIDLAY
jgi:HlyD family secretion protein